MLSTHSQPTSCDPYPEVRGVCVDEFGRGLAPQGYSCSFSTIAVLTQSSSRGYPFPVANKNTLKEDVYIFRGTNCATFHGSLTHINIHTNTPGQKRSQRLGQRCALDFFLSAWPAYRSGQLYSLHVGPGALVRND